MTDDYDLLVVGGGAAGLSGAIAVARFGRRVLVLDAGQPRNAPATGVHNLLGHDNISPLELLAKGRAEFARFGGELLRVAASTARRLPGETIRFAVDLADGRTVTARRVLVASGAVDRLPDVAGLAERWGTDVLHCPFCHGWEVRGRRIGVLGHGALAVHAAKLWSQLGSVTLVLEEPTLSEPDRAILDALGVRIVDEPALRLIVQNDRLIGLETRSGSVDIDAAVAVPFTDARSPLLASLGVPTRPIEMNGRVLGWSAEADPNGITSVPGVAVAGNVVDITAQVSQSMAAGTRAAGMLLMSLIEDEAAALTRAATIAAGTSQPSD